MVALAANTSRRNALDKLLIEICTKLQISPTVHDLVEERYHAVGKWLNESSHPWLRDSQIYPQGSFRIGTTVRPLRRQEFDLDMVCEFVVRPEHVGNPIILLDLVERRLRESEVYRDRIERKRRCIRLNYAQQFHLDILPACPDGMAVPGCLVVPDREARAWRASCPKGYAAWFEEKCVLPQLMQRFGEMQGKAEPFPDHETVHEKEPLKRVVQLIKRCRDITFMKTPDKAPISIVLTTLAGAHYRKEPSESAALVSVLNGIVGQIPEHERLYGRLKVLNPSNGKEDLSERWDTDREAYDAFKAWIWAMHRDWPQIIAGQAGGEAYRRMEVLLDALGDEPAKSAFNDMATRFEKAQSSGTLNIIKGTGVLTTASMASTVPVKPHTFHG